MSFNSNDTFYTCKNKEESITWAFGPVVIPLLKKSYSYMRTWVRFPRFPKYTCVWVYIRISKIKKINNKEEREIVNLRSTRYINLQIMKISLFLRKKKKKNSNGHGNSGVRIFFIFLFLLWGNYNIDNLIKINSIFMFVKKIYKFLFWSNKPPWGG